MSASDRKGRGLLLLASILIGFIKLVLVSRNEIVAIPDDSAVFIRHVLGGMGNLGPPVGYSLWLWFVKQTGMPQRLAIEFLYVIACICLTLVLRKRIGVVLSLLALVALVLSPATYYLFDRALTDPLFLCVTLFGICLSLLLLGRADQRESTRYVIAGALGAVLGAMAVTRNESPLAVGWMAWVALLVTLWEGRIGRSTRDAVQRGLRTLLPIAIVFFAVSVLPNSYHYVTKGVWTAGIAAMPSHMGLLKRLAAIDAGGKDVKYVAVSKRARELAYDVSPTLRKLKPYIERPDNAYVRASHDVGGLPEGEIGSGWIWHIFNEAANSAMEGEKTASKLDAMWTQASKELDEAFESGALKRRFVIHPFLGAGLIRPFASLHQGLLDTLEIALRFAPRMDDAGYIAESFDEVCNRRASLVPRQTEVASVQGWGFVDSKDSRLTAVQLGFSDAAGAGMTWTDLPISPRSDVTSAFLKQMDWQVDAWGFTGQMVVPKAAQLFVRYRTTRGELTAKALVPNRVEKEVLSDGRTQLYRGLDSFRRSATAQEEEGRSFHQFMSRMVDWRGWPLLRFLFATILIAPILLVFLVTKVPSLGSSIRYFASLCVAGLAAQRLAFYALIHENAWAVEQRYVSSLFDMLVIVLVCLLAYVLFDLKRLPQQSQAHAEELELHPAVSSRRSFES